MKTIINVECMDQELVITNSPVIASGGVHENFIAFNFCEKWDGLYKTAVFYRNEKERYYSLLDSDDICEIPHEVTDNEGMMYFGVFGKSGELIRTSKIMKYKINKGAMTTLLKPSEPTPDIYQQLLSAYEQTNKAIAKEAEERLAEIAVERERINNLSKYVTPQMFGAIGDGVSDDTQAFKDAIASMDNGVLYVPKGTYLISTLLYIPKSISVKGDGVGLTHFNFKGDNSFLYIQSANSVEISGFSVNGNNKIAVGITSYLCKYLNIHDVEIYNTHGNGINLSNSYACKISNCHIHDVGNLQCGVWCGFDVAQEHGYHVIENCNIHDIELDGAIIGDHYVKVKDCRFIYCGTGTPTSGALGACGVYVVPSKNIWGSEIIGNTCLYCTESGIDAHNARYTIIKNNTCCYNGLSGITGSFLYSNISGNICNNNGCSKQEATNDWKKDGIAVKGGTISTIITDNICCNSENKGQNFGIGHYATDDNRSDRVIMTNNCLKYNLIDDTNVGNGYAYYVYNLVNTNNM